MLTCLVISDSHGARRNVEEALARCPNTDLVIFLGDGLSDLEDLPQGRSPRALVAVRGNCDFGGRLGGEPVKKTETLFLEGHTVTLTHGDLFAAKYGFSGLSSLAHDHGADIVLFGHTHRPTEYREDGVYFFNPGSIGEPPDGEPSFGVLTLDGENVLFSFGTL